MYLLVIFLERSFLFCYIKSNCEMWVVNIYYYVSLLILILCSPLIISISGSGPIQAFKLY